MRGITEEILKELSLRYKSSLIKRLFIYLIGNECKELNAWQPIETAPKDREIILYWPCFINLEPTKMICKYNKDDWMLYIPTHWQELPQDPK
jgi:hypothetical protein